MQGLWKPGEPGQCWQRRMEAGVSRCLVSCPGESKAVFTETEEDAAGYKPVMVMKLANCGKSRGQVSLLVFWVLLIGLVRLKSGKPP